MPDYVMGQTTCALYLSLRYHQLNPNYIHDRLKQLGRSYELRVLLVQIDIKEPHHLLKELAKICILADCTLILAFSTEEAGRYLETYKVYENKPPDAIMEKTDQNFMAKMTDCLTNIKSVNKTDVATLISTFGSMKNVAEASQEDLSFCPGFGPQKAKRVHDLFKEPFLKANKK
jgi:DNA excision repair protein ERCC-1